MSHTQHNKDDRRKGKRRDKRADRWNPRVVCLCAESWTLNGRCIECGRRVE